YIGTEYSEWFTPQIMDELELLVHNLRDAVLSLINRVSRGVWNTAVSAPQMFIGFMMMFFSTFFFLRDRDRIVGFFEHQIPTKWIDFFRRARKELSVSLFAYIRAILILASITFVELLIGLTILRLPYAILIAFLCAVLDALPAIGTGWVLTPWSIVCFVMGNYRLGIGLLVLYLITWLVRQLLEARVVGGQVGIHPLLLLFSMYLGMQLFGILGLLVGPLMAIVLRSFLRIYFSGRSLKQVLYEGMDELKPAQDEDIPA
ncbi:MAG: sporulation integral membrane protein YtvI, partial [Eubacteriales bacterium]|nr:sporulation integral membrane protein YtvI [Eubacteriales bacterium]